MYKRQEYNRSIKSGHEIDNVNPYESFVELSLKSIKLTSDLVDNNNVEKIPLTKTEIFTIIQALAHQCGNPCEEIRLYALKVVETFLTEKLNLPTKDILGLEELLEGGLLPILESTKGAPGNNVKLLTGLLDVISKVYLFYLKEEITTNETFLEVLNIFNRYVEIPEIEKQLQQLIISKKEIEKDFNKSVSPQESVHENIESDTNISEPQENPLTES